MSQVFFLFDDPVKMIKNGLDSTGNSETQSSSSDDNKRRLKHWKVKTATQECDICGKEMLRSRMKKHVKLAHKSKTWNQSQCMLVTRRPCTAPSGTSAFPHRRARGTAP